MMTFSFQIKFDFSSSLSFSRSIVFISPHQPIHHPLMSFVSFLRASNKLTHQRAHPRRHEGRVQRSDEVERRGLRQHLFEKVSHQCTGVFIEIKELRHERQQH